MFNQVLAGREMLRVVICGHVRLVAKSPLDNLTKMIFLNEVEGRKTHRVLKLISLLKITCERYTIPFLSQLSFFFIALGSDASVRG